MTIFSSVLTCVPNDLRVTWAWLQVRRDGRDGRERGGGHHDPRPAGPLRLAAGRPRPGCRPAAPRAQPGPVRHALKRLQDSRVFRLLLRGEPFPANSLFVAIFSKKWFSNYYLLPQTKNLSSPILQTYGWCFACYQQLQGIFCRHKTNNSVIVK